MSLVIKSFRNNKLGLSVDTFIDNKNKIYFKGKDIANALGYEDTKKAIANHVDSEYKYDFNKGGDSYPLTNYVNSKYKHNFNKGNESPPFKNIHPQTIFISEPGVYSLIFSSKLPNAIKFRKWVFEKVLPDIRKYGYSRTFNNPNTLTFKIENEYDLHTKVVKYIKRFYPNTLIIPGLGELQDTKSKRINSFKKGYKSGQPDLIISNFHKNYNGFCIEFKTPMNNGILSDNQKDTLNKYEDNNYKTLVSNDYDVIIREVSEYMKYTRIVCRYCNRKFISNKSILQHYKYFHKLIT